MPDRTAPTVGLALLLAGMVGACGAVTPTPEPTPTTPAARPSVTTTSVPTPAGSSAATPAPSAASSASAPLPSSAAATWFEDGFDIALGWVVADPSLLQASIEGGAYVLRPRRSTEPAYSWAPKDGAFVAATVEATFTLPDVVAAPAGLAVADLDFGLRLVLLVGGDGAWRLQRDDAAALRTLASGKATAPSGSPIRLRLVLEDGAASAWAGDQQLGRAAIQIDAGHAGLAVQAAADGAVIRVDDFRVTLTR